MFGGQRLCPLSVRQTAPKDPHHQDGEIPREERFGKVECKSIRFSLHFPRLVASVEKLIFV